MYVHVSSNENATDLSSWETNDLVFWSLTHSREYKQDISTSASSARLQHLKQGNSSRIGEWVTVIGHCRCNF